MSEFKRVKKIAQEWVKNTKEGKVFKKNVSKWTELLRSGKFKQTTGALTKEIDEGVFGHCCLGVYRKGVEGKACRGKVMLPSSVLHADIADYFVELNDDKGWSFKKIAATAEKMFNW